MSDPADLLGAALARTRTSGGGDVISLEVADVTESGRVNLLLGNGDLLLDVPCPDSYRDRAAGDWVAVRLSARPVVLWRLGADPVETETENTEEIATQAALDAQVVRAATYGTGAPAGSGWQQATEVHVRKVDGKLEVYFKVGSVADPSPGTPTVPAPRPVTISPTDSGSWRGGKPDEYAASPTQGDWTGRGNRRGAWFYGSAIQNACTGKTVAKMTVRFSRKTGAGVNAKRPMHLYLHNHSSAPSGQLNLGDGPEELLSLSVGATGTATLPASWRSALASGAAKGLAIYANGSRDYMAVTGGKLTITFSA
ncbi:hypothetical protein [Streptomyces europaeiscabiei]|uniref:Minor tail protein n=1 Tax=Streptomyces europaeiscabiei TaxID=146819 RepID=A0ABU4NSM9_9ACTN|nr:hypothetical protein [Streptomyces europaeiscabiei]MDX3555178.1 hypothetical protein [Streptomyces europaeiscabiei]MDX3705192.1 hypothetical protein [Streptomyces europaeiscabiei]MDX3864397.1 hypothetical protein [Streptomyces europaeiscabiei]MDX3871521.1 hypothetical protein [Streptomyces europaeiscabiei]